MPRGQNPNSKANLVKFGSAERPARENAVKGGKKKAENINKDKAIKRTFAQLAQEMIDDEKKQELLDALTKRARVRDDSLRFLMEILGEQAVQQNTGTHVTVTIEGGGEDYAD